MATAKGQVSLHGRFRPGSVVRLVRVRDERVLRAEGGEEVDRKKVDDAGRVQFTSGVTVGARYFVVGKIDGRHVEVRARGNESGAPNTVLTDAGVVPDRVRLSDGSWADEAPEREDPPGREVGPSPAQRQVPEGVVQRSQTPRGSAHPVEVGERAPYPGQEDVPKGTVQMSQTETGRATPIVDAPARQEDVGDGVLQRSSTATGEAAVIPPGDALQAQLVRESAAAKAARGEPGQAARSPLEQPAAKGKAAEKRARPRQATSGGSTAAAKKSNTRRPAAGKSNRKKG